VLDFIIFNPSKILFLRTINKHSMKKSSLFFLFFLFTLSIFAQKITLKGLITNADTREPLVQAIVKIGNNATTTDVDGRYQLQVDKAGRYSVFISYIGFTNIEKTVEITEGGANEFNFPLSEGINLLNVATVTAGKFEKPLGEVTVSIDVIQPKLIENINARRIDDVLQKVPGVNIIDGQANIRGGSGWSYGAGSRVLLLIDDIPALQADAGFPNWTDIPVENIEQIEVVKGAASALYGSSAMNGIINVRTGFAKSEPETKVSTQYTAFLAPKDPAKKWWTKTPYDAMASINHKQKFGKFDFVGTLFYYNQSSYNKDWYNKFGRFSTAMRYRITDKLVIGLNALYNAGASQNFFYWANSTNKAYIGTPSALSATPSKIRYNIDPYITYFDKSGNRHKILTRFNSIDNQVNNNQNNASDLQYGEYQFQRQFEKLVITAGLVGIATSVRAKLYSDTTFSSNNIAAYTQADLKLGKLNLSAGFRYERNTINGPKLVRYSAFLPVESTPNGGKLQEAKPVFRIGANYQLGKATFLRTSWGQGYRFPTIAEMFISTIAGSLPVIPNPFLTSETGWTAEVGVKQGFKVGGFNGFFDAAIFQSEYKNMMEFQASKKVLGFQSQNSGDTRIKGFEVSMAGQGKIGDITPSFLIGYTYIDPKYKEFTQALDDASSVDYNVLKYRFKHNFKFDYEMSYKSLSLGAALLYNSRMEAVDRIIELAVPEVKEYRLRNSTGFMTFDVRFSVKPIEKLKFSIIGANLLNEEYSYRPGLLEPPRNVQIRIDIKF
jgi:outer membrane receptor protein involved in Fe transport